MEPKTCPRGEGGGVGATVRDAPLDRRFEVREGKGFSVNVLNNVLIKRV